MPSKTCSVAIDLRDICALKQDMFELPLKVASQLIYLFSSVVPWDHCVCLKVSLYLKNLTPLK